MQLNVPAANTVAAADPAGGAPPVHWIVMMAAFEAASPKSWTLALATVEYSPALAKRNDVPHEPLIVAPISSDNSQVNPSLGLLVAPFSVP
jgi:hypothetical protein